MREADAVCKVLKPSPDEVARLRDGQVLSRSCSRSSTTELVAAVAERGVTAFSMDSIPRVTRAQPMDALSSQSTVSGYKAAVLAAEHLGKFFPMLTTAAGTIPPAKVLVLGAGVAGLQAIATATPRRRRLRLRRAPGREGAGREPRRDLPRARRRGAEGVGGYAVALAEDQHEREQELIARTPPSRTP